MAHFKCCHKFPLRITGNEDILKPYSAKEDLGRILTKYTVRTRKLGMQLTLLIVGILPK